ncbi:sugar transporter ERD6-like 5 isoform X4 [Cornus florida]|uniref:sugar transporter ERD6-like 5 isoform X4 n=1 Tax=Cornus florida TaxID=4283 RepID=UPI00289A7B61|nr:sugar transporter ERD6-like 5 isoform X4 [Cornus florida]
MNKASMEEGLLNSSLIPEEKPEVSSINGGGCSKEVSGSSAITAVVVLSIFVAASGSFAYGCSVGYSSPAESGIMNDLGLSTAEYSVFSSITTIGGMIGAVITGKVADLVGRRGYVVLANILHHGMAFNNFCKGIVPCLVQVVGLFFIPESPRWLAMIGKEKESEATLQRLRGEKCDISQEAAEIRDYTEILQGLSQSRILDLFERRYAHSLIVGVGLMLLIQFGGNCAIAFYASSILEAAGCSASVGTTAMAIIQIPFSILGVYSMDKFGRRPLLMVTAALTCLGTFLAGLAFLLQDFDQWKELSAALILSGLLVFSAGFYTGVGGTPWIIMSEIFPINIKSSAGSLVTLTNWFGSWIVSYTYNFLFEWSSAGVFFIYTIFSGLVIVFVAILVPETKGKTLEEIQASMIDLLH